MGHGASSIGIRTRGKTTAQGAEQGAGISSSTDSSDAYRILILTDQRVATPLGSLHATCWHQNHPAYLALGSYTPLRCPLGLFHTPTPPPVKNI